MPQHAPARWIVAYDIAHRRRWAPIYKLLKKHGIPLQYSVFVVEASAVQINSLMEQLKKLINPRQDDIRAYRMQESAVLHTLGAVILPEGVWLTASTPPTSRKKD